MSTLVGQRVPRVDGRAKVTGQAQYAADFGGDALLHAVLFESTIACGTIRSFDLDDARGVPGVVEIVTFQNARKLKKPKNIIGGAKGEGFMPLQSNEVFYNGQFIGAVLAETLEAAQDAARRVKVAYDEKPAKLDFDALLDTGHDPGTQYYQKVSKKRGDAAKAIDGAEIVVADSWLMPTEHHNPMEPCAVTVSIEGDQLIVHDSTQAVIGTGQQYAKVLGLKPKNVHLTSKFIGGAFGCKGPFWPHQAIAGIATMMTGRPVKLALTRQQMFNGAGHRARVIQQITLGADKDGQLKGMRHVAHNATAMTIDYCEDTAGATPLLYACEHVETKQIVVPLNYMTPGSMRAPGHASGSWALEGAMDELAERVGLDPIEIRLKNYAEIDPERERPFTSKSLRECYAEGAAAFGWDQRPATPRTRRDGDWWVGYGMASCTYPAMRVNARATARLLANGRLEVRSATQDLGTGAWTILTQIAADELGLGIDDIDFDLGDNRFPPSGVSGGSTGAASVGSAVALACRAVREKLEKLAIGDVRSPLHGHNGELEFVDGAVRSKADPSRTERYEALLGRHGGKPVEGDGKVGVYDIIKGVMFSDSGHAFGAQFAEVRVHAATGEVRVGRLVGAFGCGRILNPMTAESQIAGGMIWGIGQALMEETIEDVRTGRLATKDFADYHVPVQADVPEIAVIFVDERDDKINPLGIKGVGEIGICGVAGAITNAVYNATGIRVRELPITPDKIISGLDMLE